MRQLLVSNHTTLSRLEVCPGDFVDRGAWGLEVLILLAAWKLAMPQYVTLLRGNHESTTCTRLYGFHAEMQVCTAAVCPPRSCAIRCREPSEMLSWPGVVQVVVCLLAGQVCVRVQLQFCGHHASTCLRRAMSLHACMGDPDKLQDVLTHGTHTSAVLPDPGWLRGLVS